MYNAAQREVTRLLTPLDGRPGPARVRPDDDTVLQATLRAAQLQGYHLNLTTAQWSAFCDAVATAFELGALVGRRRAVVGGPKFLK